MESLIAEALSLAEAIGSAITTGVSVNTIGQMITNPLLVNAFTDIGSKLVPKAAPVLQAAAAIVTSYSPDYTKWVQNSLNKLVTPSPNLLVDGKYGPKTKAAVEALQTKLGLKVDGWAGDITMAAVQLALTKH